MTRTFTICTALVIRLALPADDAGGLLFHASYDSALDADVARGDSDATVLESDGDREPRLVKGVLGKGVLVPRRGLRYEAHGNLSSAEGTIEFWFQPVDWDGSDGLMHHLFGTDMKPKCHMLIYRYMRTKRKIGGIFGQFAFYIRGGDPQDAKHSLVIPRTRVSDGWKRSEWHHVVGTWGKQQARLYVDGALVGQAHGKLPSDEPRTFTVSGNGADKGVANVIDELRIYDRVLKLQEIAAHYVRGKRVLVLRQSPATPQSPEELGRRLKVGCLFQDGLRKLLVRVDATELPVPDLPALRVAMVVLADGATPVVELERVAVSELCVAEATLAVEELPAGTHRLDVIVADAEQGTILARVKGEVVRPEAGWLGNDIGRSDAPVAPFEPVVVEGGRVRLWGKHYELDGHLLLKQAVVRPDPNAALHRTVTRFWHEAELLAEPIRLVGTFGSSEVDFAKGTARLVSASQTHAVFETRARHGTTSAKVRLRFDDDSIITADVSLAFDQPTDVKDLRLEIPLKTRYCQWMNWTSLAGHRDASGSGAIPPGEGVVWQGVFHPLLWLGDDYRGFGYFCDTSRGWTGDLTAPDRVLIRREGDVTRAVLCFVPEGKMSDWEAKVSFLATPARPLPAKWRGMSLGGNFRVRHVPYREACPMHVVYWWTTAFFEQKQDHFSSPRTDTLRLDAIGSAIAQNGDEPISHVFYTYPNSYHHPIVRHFYSDWCNKPTEDLVGALGQREAPTSTRVDWNTSVRDCWLYQMDKLADLGVDGIYCDDPYTHPSFNHRTGTAFIGEDGEIRPNYGLYGLREYFRRLRCMLNQKANNPHLLLHMSNQLTLPFQIYFDSFANGEHLNQRLKQHYIGKLSTDEIRAQYLGYQWGNIPIILPELGGEFRKSVEATEEMLALLLPHDVLIWVAWCHAKTATAYNDVLQREFMMWADDCSFLPYWEARKAIQGQDDTLVASAYVRTDSVLLVVANWADTSCNAELKLDWPQLTKGQAMRSVRVAMGKGIAELDGSRLSVAVPGRNLRLVILSR